MGFPTLAIVTDLGATAFGMTGKLPWTSEGASAIVCTTGICMAGLLALFFFERKLQAPSVLIFNALVAVGLIARLGMIGFPWWVKLISITVTTGFIFGSGILKIVDASGVLSTEALTSGTAKSGRTFALPGGI